MVGSAETKHRATQQSWWQRLRSAELRATLGSTLGLDLRSIALFRVAVGALMVSDAYHRSRHLVAHYTDEGIIPRDKLLGGWSNPLFYSFHNWGGDVTSQTLLFVIAGIVGMMLLVGYKTRLASILAFLLVASSTFQRCFVPDMPIGPMEISSG